MAKKIYGDAESVEVIAQQVLPNYHPELASARMKYVFVSEGSMKHGRPVYGKVRRITGALEHLLELDFLVEVALNTWNPLTLQQRTAVVDHLLERCTGAEDEQTGEMTWSVRDPEVQEFASILSRHGAWHDGLDALVEVAQRINLDQRMKEATGTVLTEQVRTQE